MAFRRYETFVQHCFALFLIIGFLTLSLSCVRKGGGAEKYGSEFDRDMAQQGTIYAGPWCGALHGDSALLKAVILNTATEVRLIFSKDEALTSGKVVKPNGQDIVENYPHKIITFKLNGLTPNTRYYYALEVDTAVAEGTFKTFPREGEQISFRFALSSCSKKPYPTLFEKFIETEIDVADDADKLLFFCHLGDFHYANLGKNPIRDRLKALNRSLRKPGYRKLFQKLPVVYTWDDHDFLGNNTGGGYSDTRKYAKDALKAYSALVPHYDFVNSDDGIYQEFTVGNVLFLLTDTRYNRTNKGHTVLGEKQKAWLQQKLIEGQERDLIVWANSMPWIDRGGSRLKRLMKKIAGLFKREWKPDTWYGYSRERDELAQFVKDNNITNLCMISGDAHMLAIDSGSL